MTNTDRWFATHDNISFLAGYMAHNRHDAFEVADMVEKPWKYEDLYFQARREQERELAAEAAKYTTSPVHFARDFATFAKDVADQSVWACMDEGQHMAEVDDQGYCTLCGFITESNPDVKRLEL
jgi:hypothetical protein